MKKILKMLTMACVMSMFVVFGAVTLPTNPSPAQASLGKNYLLNINTGTATTPVWTLIGGQRAGTLSRKGESIDTSDKTTGGWKSSLIGLLSWSIALDGLVLLQDAGLQALEQAFNAAQQINVQFLYPDGTYRTGWGSISEFTMDNQYNQAATLKGTIEGVGPLSGLQPAVSPLTVTVSKSAATSQVFTLAPTTDTIVSVANGTTTLTVSTQYTTTANTVTILGTYLATLGTGTITFNITDVNGVVISFTIVLTA